MYKDLIRQLKLSLHLAKEPVGIHFFLIPEEYEEVKLSESRISKSLCTYVNESATKKIHQKVCLDYVSCAGALSALGLVPAGNFVKSGKQYFLMKLYKSLSIAKKAISQMSFVDCSIYGFEVGPLSELSDADVVLILGNPWQMMRIVQGYTYQYSAPENLGTIGNQGICADLIARPFQKNDFNLSMLCPGARIHMKSSENEMGCGMPMWQFENIVSAVIKTTSLTMTKNEKEKLLKNMKSLEELDCKIELDKMYGSYLKNSPYPPERYDNFEYFNLKGD